jgi:uncharacterized membrane protein (DUF485 family)
MRSNKQNSCHYSFGVLNILIFSLFYIKFLKLQQFICFWIGVPLNVRETKYG